MVPGDRASPGGHPDIKVPRPVRPGHSACWCYLLRNRLSSFKHFLPLAAGLQWNYLQVGPEAGQELAFAQEIVLGMSHPGDVTRVVRPGLGAGAAAQSVGPHFAVSSACPLASRQRSWSPSREAGTWGSSMRTSMLRKAVVMVLSPPPHPQIGGSCQSGARTYHR